MKHGQKSQVARGGRTNEAQGLGWCNDGLIFQAHPVYKK